MVDDEDAADSAEPLEDSDRQGDEDDDGFDDLALPVGEIDDDFDEDDFDDDFDDDFEDDYDGPAGHDDEEEDDLGIGKVN